MLEVNTVDMMEQLNAFWPIILMVVIFYFMLWRPQKKQQKQRQEMLNSLKAGVKIITAGGIYGTIVSLHDEYLVIRVADKVEIKITRNAVNQVLGKQDRSEGKKSKKAEKKADPKPLEKGAEAKQADATPAEPKAAEPAQAETAAPAEEKKTEESQDAK